MFSSKSCILILLFFTCILYSQAKYSYVEIRLDNKLTLDSIAKWGFDLEGSDYNKSTVKLFMNSFEVQIAILFSYFKTELLQLMHKLYKLFYLFLL